jgi:hypothetical protein
MTIKLKQEGSINFIQSGNTTATNSIADLRFTNLNSGSSGTTLMTLTTAGNVGIGTTNPQFGLDLYGDIRLNADVPIYENYGITIFNAFAGDYLYIYEYNYGGSYSTKFEISNNSFTNISGNTLSCKTAFSFYADNYFYEDVTIRFAIENTSGSLIRNLYEFTLPANSTSQLYESGNINFSINNGHRIVAKYDKASFFDPSEGSFIYINPNEIIFSESQEKFRMESGTTYAAGNIGIGTTSPTYNLDVQSSARFNNLTVTAKDYGTYPLTIWKQGTFSYDPAYRVSMLWLNAEGEGSNNNFDYIRIQNNGSFPALFTVNALGDLLLPSSKIGVGTSTPSQRLEVAGAIRISTAPSISYDGDAAIIFNQAEVGPTIQGYQFDVRTGSATSRMRINNTGNVGIGTTSPLYTLDVNGTLDVSNSNGVILFNSAGNFGIGTTAPAYKLVVAGDIYATGDVMGFSDERLKTDISTIPDALNKVESMRGVNYTMKSTGKRSVGVIAQEMQQVLPEVIAEKEEYLGVSYGNIVGVLIEAIKELSQKIKDLESKLQ